MKNNHTLIDPKTGLNILRGHITYAGQDCWQIAVYCPYCRCDHYHGWPIREEDFNHMEHRVCHCHDTPHRLKKDSPYSDPGYLIGIIPEHNNTKRSKYHD